MSNAEDIRSLAQDITASYDARIEELASTRQEVSDMLDGFKKEGEERKTEVSDILDGFKKEREDTAGAWRDLAATMQAKRTAGHTTRTKEFSSGEEPAVHSKAMKARKG